MEEVLKITDNGVTVKKTYIAAAGNGLFFRPHIFHAHVLYRELLVSLQSSALSLVISRKKY